MTVVSRVELVSTMGDTIFSFNYLVDSLNSWAFEDVACDALLLA